MHHELQNGINLAIGRRNATLKGGRAGSGRILSTVITCSSHGTKGSGTTLSKVYCDQVLYVEQ